MNKSLQSDGELDRLKEGNPAKVEQMAEILSLLHETHKDKNWLKEQVEKHRPRVRIKPSMNSLEILRSCPEELIIHLLRILKGQDLEGFDKVNALTKTYHWFFCDIVAGSNPTIPTKDQVRKIFALNELISRIEIFKRRDLETTVILPTGDGYAIGFGDSPEKPLRLAIELHKALNKYNKSRRGKEKLLIRIGIDMGPVYVIKDLSGHDNVWGPGIILTRRVMDLGGDMQILTSARIAEDIRKLSPEYKDILHPIGDYSIKHGEQLILYNIYGDGFGNKIAPRKSKIFKESIQKKIANVNNFVFDKIGVELEILDPKTMLTHHTWIWHIVNVSKESKDQIFYYLDGDSPKEFSDMNVTVRDEKGNNFEILALSVNKPYHKEFNVQLKRPLKPKQRKVIILEYDWEEPERTFFYKFASHCKKFTYFCKLPKEIKPRSRVLRVDTETGYKAHASPPATIKYLDDRTEISWAKTNLRSHEAYQFDW